MTSELKLLFGERAPYSVLEIGCGNGRLFDLLGFNPRFYRGVDFSPRKLEVFQKNHPELDLVEAEASSYADDRTYDLIFAHDVISHFSSAMLAQHCRNVRSMMHGASLLVWASVPWRSLRTSYDLGMWSNGGKPSIIRWGKSNNSARAAARFDRLLVHNEPNRGNRDPRLSARALSRLDHAPVPFSCCVVGGRKPQRPNVTVHVK